MTQVVRLAVDLQSYSRFLSALQYDCPVVVQTPRNGDSRRQRRCSFLRFQDSSDGPQASWSFECSLYRAAAGELHR